MCAMRFGEDDRLAAVQRLGILDSPAEERFDVLTRLAAATLSTPIALVSVIDTDRQWFKSRVGLGVAQTPRVDAFCAHAIASDDDLFVVADAGTDERFRNNPLVTGDPNIRFYAGRVVRAPGGEPVGTLCVIDRAARTLTPDEATTLRDLAGLVERELGLTALEEHVARVDTSDQSKTRILHALHEGLVLHAADGRIVEWNPAAERVLGLSADELAGRTSMDPRWRAVHPDGTPWPGDDHPSMRALRSGVPVLNEMMGVHRPDGTLAWLRVNAHPTVEPQGGTTGVVVAFEDRTEEQLLELALRRSETAARTSLDALDQGVILASADGTIHRINPAAELILGYPADQLTEMWRTNWVTYDTDGNVLPPEERPVLRALQTGQPVRGVVAGWKRPDGEMILIKISCTPSADGAADLVIAFGDVTEEHRMNREVSRFKYLFQNANDLVAVIDETGQIRYSSPSAAGVLGYPAGWQSPGGVLGIVHPDDLPDAAGALTALLNGTGATDPFIVRVQTFAGAWRHMECVGVNLLDEPAVRGIVITARDATDRVLLSEELAHRASHDELTDLPSRRLLESRLSDALSRSSADGTRVGVCFIDLDGFKQINDTLGHAAGDDLLVDVARRIQDAIRGGGDMAARVGGDEFVVVLDPITSPDEALAVARRLRDSVASATSPSPGLTTFGASVGLAIGEPTDTPSSMLRRADHALYCAKQTRDSSIAVSEPLTGPRLV